MININSKDLFSSAYDFFSILFKSIIEIGMSIKGEYGVEFSYLFYLGVIVLFFYLIVKLFQIIYTLLKSAVIALLILLLITFAFPEIGRETSMILSGAGSLAFILFKS